MNRVMVRLNLGRLKQYGKKFRIDMTRLFYVICLEGFSLKCRIMGEEA